MLAGPRLWVGLLISAVCVYLAFRNIDLAEAATAAARANYLWAIPALILYFGGVWVRAVRWHLLLRPIRAVPIAALFPIVVVGYMANNLLPARMGEVARAYLFGRREGVSGTATLGTIAVERIFDGIAMLTFMGAAAAIAPLPEELRQIGLAGAVVFAILIAAFLLAAFFADAAVSLLRRVLSLAPGRSADRIATTAARFFDGLASLRSGRLLVSILLLSLTAWLLEAGMYYLIGVGFGLNLPPPVFLLTLAAANLATLVPSSPGYVGPFDAAAILVLTLFGADHDLAASYTIVLHIILLLPITALGLLYLWRDHLSLGDVAGRGPVTE